MKKMMKAVAALMLMMTVVFAAGCKKQEPSSGSYNGHEYVDLGLPSGTMWATSNLDAGNSKGYAYFAWGETETKTNYDWSTYKWCDGDAWSLNKYCTKADHGNYSFIDNLTILETEDDAATVHWGEGWRTPSHEDWQELIDNCTYEWTKKNGIFGGLFTASNGNTLFLPAAGHYDYPDIGLLGYNIQGKYWSLSLDLDYPHLAHYFTCDEIVGPNNYNSFVRSEGCTIRPVHSAN